MDEKNVRASGEKGSVFGIDLGTSNCCVALWSQGTADIVHNSHGERTTPSVVSLYDNNSILVGAPAQRQAVMNPTCTISEVKRLVGHRYTAPEVSATRKTQPYEIFCAPNGDAWIRVANREFCPQEIQAYILEELAATMSLFLGKKEARRAVVTVPAYYNEVQRQAVRDAATIAGISAVRILTEPTAAALAYGYLQLDNRRIAVVDLGGGTLDVTIMHVHEGKFEVLATDGDPLLGGMDFDQTLAQHFVACIQKYHDLDVADDLVAMQRLVAEAERAKKQLTEQQTISIQLPYLAQKGDEPVNFSCQLTREQYEDLVSSLVQRIAKPCRAAAAQAGIPLHHLDDVILIGGMTRSPVVNRCIGGLFQRKPLLRINPDEAVAMGAALLGASLNGLVEEVEFIDVASQAIGILGTGDQTFVPLIQKSKQLPTQGRTLLVTTADQQERFNVDLFQANSTLASENQKLADVCIENLPLRPTGQVSAQMTVQIGSNGVLLVSATESNTSRPLDVVTTFVSGLTSEQVHKLSAQHKKERQAAESADILDGDAQRPMSLTLNPIPVAQPTRLDAETLFSEADNDGHAQRPMSLTLNPTPVAQPTRLDAETLFSEVDNLHPTNAKRSQSGTPITLEPASEHNHPPSVNAEPSKAEHSPFSTSRIMSAISSRFPMDIRGLSFSEIFFNLKTLVLVLIAISGVFFYSIL